VAAYKARRNPDRCPSHPGAAVLDDILPSLGRPKAEIARLLGISRQHLHEILEEKKPVSPNGAARIGKLIGNGPAPLGFTHRTAGHYTTVTDLDTRDWGTPHVARVVQSVVFACRES
jgi:addiction module HigA family antidote